MIKKILDYIKQKKQEKKLVKITEDIYTKYLSFDELCNKYDNTEKISELLLMYSMISVASDRSASIFEERYVSVLELHYENMKTAYELNSYTEVAEEQKIKSEIAFLNNQIGRINGKKSFEKDEYIYDSMIYKMENINKGPITPEQLELVKKTSSKLEQLTKKIEKIKKDE